MPRDREEYLEELRGQDEEMHLEHALFPWLDDDSMSDSLEEHYPADYLPPEDETNCTNCGNCFDATDGACPECGPLVPDLENTV